MLYYTLDKMLHVITQLYHSFPEPKLTFSNLQMTKTESCKSIFWVHVELNNFIISFARRRWSILWTHCMPSEADISKVDWTPARANKPGNQRTLHHFTKLQPTLIRWRKWVSVQHCGERWFHWYQCCSRVYSLLFNVSKSTADCDLTLTPEHIDQLLYLQKNLDTQPVLVVS